MTTAAAGQENFAGNKSADPLSPSNFGLDQQETTNMRSINRFAIAVAVMLSCRFAAAEEHSIPNPMIDYRGFLENAVKVKNLRDQRRISEADFLRLAAQPGTIIFDARSDAKFAMLHVRGAKHLS